MFFTFNGLIVKIIIFCKFVNINNLINFSVDEFIAHCLSISEKLELPDSYVELGNRLYYGTKNYTGKIKS